MNQFELYGGDHTEADGTVVRNGEVIESDLPLNIMFPGKFKPYNVAPTKKPVNRKSAVTESQGEQGENVTGEFEGAAALGMTIVKLGRKYSVVNADGETVLAGASKAQVVNAIESASSEEDEEIVEE